MPDKKVEALTQQLYFTQKELAARWKVSQSSIINWRKRGIIPFLNLPGSVRVLYPVNEIIELENQYLSLPKGAQRPEYHQYQAVRNKKNYTESKRKTPAVSAKPNKDWRV